MRLGRRVVRERVLDSNGSCFYRFVRHRVSFPEPPAVLVRNGARFLSIGPAQPIN